MKIILILFIASLTQSSNAQASDRSRVLAEAAAKGIDMSNSQVLQGRDGIPGEAAGDFVVIGANGGCRFQKTARPQILCWLEN